ncbi:MAG: hypothetical protein ACETWT_01470 [Thermodesulfobacteriota bacterium]
MKAIAFSSRRGISETGNVKVDTAVLLRDRSKWIEYGATGSAKSGERLIQRIVKKGFDPSFPSYVVGSWGIGLPVNIFVTSSGRENSSSV